MRVWTVQEASVRLNVDEGYIRRVLTSSGIVGIEHVGKQWIGSEEDWKRWESSRTKRRRRVIRESSVCVMERDVLAIDVACGPGGFSEGWALATGRKDNIIGFDFNETARKTYEAGGFKAYHGDLFDTDDFVRRVFEATGGRRPNIVIGSSSCKGWNTTGKRLGAADPRDTLLPWLRAVGRIQPDIAVMENVKQASGHPDWIQGLNELCMPLVGALVLKAHHYGVPTNRERAFWIWRRDNYWPTKPMPTSAVQAQYGSIVSHHGRKNEASYQCYLEARVLGFNNQGVWRSHGQWKQLTHEEALEIQGAAGKVIIGAKNPSAQQIADMIPPPLAAAVIRAATVGFVSSKSA